MQNLMPTISMANATCNLLAVSRNISIYRCDTLQTEDSLRAIIEAEFEGNLELTEENRIKLKDMPNKKIAV